MLNNKRNESIDILKGLLIILVVIGHCIQYGLGIDYKQQSLFYENFLFKVIYSFHMPLFMIISGYLFYKSTKKHTSFSIIKGRFKRLIVPFLIWGIIYSMFVVNKQIVSYNGIDLFFTTLIYSFWFVQAVFYFSIITLIINRIFKDNILIVILLIISFFIIPDSYNLSVYKFTYFYFIIGYYINKYDLIVKYKTLNDKYKIGIFCSTLLLYMVLLLLYNKDMYIYTTGINILNNSNQIYINLYRWIIGLLGSYCFYEIVLFILRKTENKFKFIQELGKASIMIYIFNCFSNQLLIRIRFLHPSIVYIIIESIIIILIGIIMYKVLSKNNITSELLLGEKVKK